MTTGPQVLLINTRIIKNFDPFLKRMGNSAMRKGTKYLGEAVLIPSCVLETLVTLALKHLLDKISEPDPTRALGAVPAL